MIKVDIKPLSVNKAWQGRRYKTPAYKKYEKDVLMMLPNKVTIPDPPYLVKMVFGFSSKLADLDNPLKLNLDIIQKKYGINDRDVYRIELDKDVVDKGKEYFKFSIESIII